MSSRFLLAIGDEGTAKPEAGNTVGEGVAEAVGLGYVADEIHAGGHSAVVAIGDELVRAIRARPPGTAVANELLQTETAVPLELADELRHGDGKVYSPRTDLHISRLIEALQGLAP